MNLKKVSKTMKNNLTDYIIKNKLKCIFVSPHFDDVALSCSTLLEELAGKTEIVVINAFTEAHKGPYTLSARKFLHDSTNYSDATNLFNAREKEDTKVLSRFPLSIVNFGLEDALFRRKKQKAFLANVLPEFDHIYPTYRWHLLKGIAKNDTALFELKKKLEPFKKENILVFTPYGIGGHVDHLAVRKACIEVFDNVLLYSDFPYNMRLNSYGDAINNGEIYTIQPDLHKKEELLKGYVTQFAGLFPTGKIAKHQEMYFSIK
jgi:LmbE family N-acetylglucosaminyl deacetylase